MSNQLATPHRLRQLLVCLLKSFDPAQHPRAGKGGEAGYEGGQFVPKLWQSVSIPYKRGRRIGWVTGGRKHQVKVFLPNVGEVMVHQEHVRPSRKIVRFDPETQRREGTLKRSKFGRFGGQSRVIPEHVLSEDARDVARHRSTLR